MYLSRTLTAGALAAAAILLAGCGSPEPAKRSVDGPVMNVSTVKTAIETVPENYEAVGTVRARVSSVLAARVMGYIREIKAQAGDRVAAGQTVALLEAKDIDAAVRQAEAGRREAQAAIPETEQAIAAAKAQLELASATFKRMQTLFDQKSTTSQEFDEAAARRNVAQAGVEMAVARKAQLQQKIQQASEAVAQAEVMRSYTTVSAPFAGVVVERKAEPGMLASPGMPLLVLEQDGGFRLEAQVEESRLPRIKVGMPVRVELEAMPATTARVSEIVPAIDPSTRTFTVRIDLPGASGLRGGMFGRALFRMGDKTALMVPEGALVQQGQLQKLYVVDGSIARGRLVTAGARQGGKYEILSGLSPGEVIVSPAPQGLTDGARIEVKP